MLREAVEALARPGVAFADVLEAHYLGEREPTVKEAHALGVLEEVDDAATVVVGDGAVEADRLVEQEPAHALGEVLTVAVVLLERFARHVGQLRPPVVDLEAGRARAHPSRTSGTQAQHRRSGLGSRGRSRGP